MPDTVPFLDANGNKQTMSTYDYIKAELGKELSVRDDIASALADESSEGIIPQFKAAVQEQREARSYKKPVVGKYWYPNMEPSEIAEVKSLAQNEAKKTDNYLGIDAKWLYNNQKGHRYFALYSTAREKITLLYASKDDSAKREHDLIRDIIEEDGLNEGADTGSTTIGKILSRAANANNRQTSNSSGIVGAGSNARNAKVHSGDKRKQLSEAFISCLRNIQEVQKQYGLDDRYLFAVDRGDYATAQRMVDEASAKAGYITSGYHGSRTPGFTVVDKYSWLWLARNKSVANEYGTHTEVDNIGKPHDKKGVYAMRYNLGKNLVVYADGNSWGELPVTEDEYPGVYADEETGDITTNAMAEWAERNGYDSITFVDVMDGGNSPTTVDVVFNPNRDAKSADPVTYDDDGNVIPLSDRFNPAKKDIRYKRPVQDSAGRSLSEGQQEYFAESQARTLSGALASLFHGTENGGFTEFDPSFSDDGISLFMTDNILMAATYSGSTDLIQLAKGKPKLLRWMDGDPTRGKGQRGVYNVYANLKNPLIVDAHGENWNNLSSKQGYDSVDFEVAVEDYGDVDWNSTNIRLTTKVNGKAQNQTFHSLDALGEYLSSQYDKSIAGRIAMVALRSVDSANTVSIKWDSVNKMESWRESTREIARKAKAQGYDGVIIRNVFDSGKYGKHDANEMGNVYIAFDSNQIKSVDNKNPTEHRDVRYKLPVGETAHQRQAAKDTLALQREALRDQKNDTRIMEREFARLARVFETQARRSGKKDVEISDLKAALKAEAKKHRGEQKLWEAEFNRLLRAYETADRKIDRLEETVAHQRQAAKDKIEGRRMTEMRHKIIRFKEKLQSTLQHPTDSQYVPVDLIGAMVDLCELIDTDSPLYKKDGSLNNAQAERDATRERLLAMKDAYSKLKTNSDPVYAGEFDEMIETYLDELRKDFTGKSLKDMSLDELQQMYEILRAIDETLQDARKLIDFGEKADVYEAGDAIIDEQRAITKKRKNGRRSAAQRGSDVNLFYTLSPMRNVERMSGYHKDSFLLRLFQKFEDGIRKKNKFMMDAYKTFEELTSGKEYQKAMYEAVGNRYEDVYGRQFSVSKMQMMQAILSFEREAANGHNHIQKGGFTFADLGKLKKGQLSAAISEEYAHRVPAAAEMVDEFSELLKKDEWCQKYMEAARNFFNGMAKDAINETSIAWKHRVIAQEKSYIPYEVDKNFVVNLYYR